MTETKNETIVEPNTEMIAVDEVTLLKQETQELKDKNLRLVAEMQNQQRRSRREKEEDIKFAEFGFAKELLVILDGLEKALADGSQRENDSVVNGIGIVYKQFQKILSDHGIEKINAALQPFNPDFHEAVMQEISYDHDVGIVLQQLACGYKMHGRVLRTSKVVVSKRNE